MHRTGSIFTIRNNNFSFILKFFNRHSCISQKIFSTPIKCESSSKIKQISYCNLSFSTHVYALQAPPISSNFPSNRHADLHSGQVSMHTKQKVDDLIDQSETSFTFKQKFSDEAAQKILDSLPPAKKGQLLNIKRELEVIRVFFLILFY